MFANVVVEKMIQRFLPTVSNPLPTIYLLKPNASFKSFIAGIFLRYEFKKI
jgi:hypothetical protein